LPSALLILCFNFLLAYIRVGLNTSLFLKQIKEELIVVTYPSVITHSARCHLVENSRHFWYRRSLERYSTGACTVAFISGAQRSNRSSLGRVDQRPWNLGNGLICGTWDMVSLVELGSKLIPRQLLYFLILYSWTRRNIGFSEQLASPVPCTLSRSYTCDAIEPSLRGLYTYLSQGEVAESW
jgi:hypothetical protein